MSRRKRLRRRPFTAATTRRDTSILDQPIGAIKRHCPISMSFLPTVSAFRTRATVSEHTAQA